jgi:hypothetical protein
VPPEVVSPPEFETTLDDRVLETTLDDRLLETTLDDRLLETTLDDRLLLYDNTTYVRACYE